MASGVRHLRTATALLLGVSLCEVSAMASSKQAFRAGPDLGLPFSTAVRMYGRCITSTMEARIMLTTYPAS